VTGDRDLPDQGFGDEEEGLPLEARIEQAIARLRIAVPKGLPPEHHSREEAALRRIEAIIFSAGEPVTVPALRKAMPDADISALLVLLGTRWQDRGVVLQKIGGGYAFTTAPDLGDELAAVMPPAPARLSSAAQEVLAIIAYHQPATRPEIEAIRGVPVQRATLDVLIERGWVETRGRRLTPGRPMTFGVTARFLADIGLDRVDDLPSRRELAAAGLLSPHLPVDFEVPGPADDLPDRDDAMEIPFDDEFMTDFVGRDDESD
jgi:segregation and condensation protein B